MLHDEVDYMRQDTSESRQAEAVNPQQDHSGSRLSTITEAPSDLTEEALFCHDAPHWARHDLLVVMHV